MRVHALPYLTCPRCGGELSLAAQEQAADGHVLTGTLHCAACAKAFTILRGVPRLLRSDVQQGCADTAERFGAQWMTFSHMASYQEAWLSRWLHPLGPEDFAGRKVLEAGCGKGRHTVVACGWGAEMVVAIDLSDSVDVAFQHTRHLENALIVQGDLLHAPARPGFDIVFSVGVLHHLPDPRAGFDAIWPLLRPGGRIAIWVYGYESNEWLVRYVDPLRLRVTARMPPRLLYWLSLPPSAVLGAALHLVGSPRIAAQLPYLDYLRQLAQLPLREVHNIVFDQLVAPIAHYLPQEEVRSWFQREDFEGVQIGWHNRNSWRASATRRPGGDGAARPAA